MSTKRRKEERRKGAPRKDPNAQGNPKWPVSGRAGARREAQRQQARTGIAT